MVRKRKINFQFSCKARPCVYVFICKRPHFTSFHSVFHSFHGGLMNSINWPASSAWVFIAQLEEHCSANAEAIGSNPVEALKNLFSFGLLRNCLNCGSTAMVTYSFHLYSRSSHHFIPPHVSFLNRFWPSARIRFCLKNATYGQVNVTLGIHMYQENGVFKHFHCWERFRHVALSKSSVFIGYV